MPPVLAIVIPCYNEEEALPLSLNRLVSTLDALVAGGIVSAGSYLMCVDDGSRDHTWQIISRAHEEDARIRGISLAHNRGHQFALLAGLLEVTDRCDAAITIDADLQDDPGAMEQMIRKFSEDGAEIVYGVRRSRSVDSAFKRNTAHAFYRLRRSMGLDTVYDHADYRLLSNRALLMLEEYGERNLFLRGIVSELGLREATVSYDRQSRVAGRSKYPLRKMISFSVDGITSFSTRPIKMILMVGLLLLILDIAMSVYVLISYFSGQTIPGWTSLMLSTWLLGSLILISLGIVGEYIGKIFIEVKQRPRFTIINRI